MLIDRERMVAILNRKSKPGVKESQCGAADTFNAERRNAERTNRIPHAHHLDPDRLRILEHPLLFERNVGKGAGQLKLSKLP